MLKKLNNTNIFSSALSYLVRYNNNDNNSNNDNDSNNDSRNFNLLFPFRPLPLCPSSVSALLSSEFNKSVPSIFNESVLSTIIESVRPKITIKNIVTITKLFKREG